MTVQIEFIVNGKNVAVETDPRRPLVKVLREDLFLTGTKEGCGTGECGACTVILDGEAVNSCLVPIGQVEGKEILTIEGLPDEDGKLHPLQQAFIDEGAVQCGFCIPGMVLSAKALLDRKKKPTVDEIRVALAGNLCRCTGYTKIISAVRKAAVRLGRRR